MLTSSLEILQKPFIAVWNAPSIICEKKFGVVLNLSVFDIVSNTAQTLNGHDMVIFYQDFGLYPQILPNGTLVNGGLPQLADFSRHYHKSERDIEKAIKNRTFDGLGVIDWESWRPIFNRNLYNKIQKRYVDLSIKYVEQNHPHWNQSQVHEVAQYEFEMAARFLMEGTIRLGKQLRPQGRWGFYGFPSCYNYRPGESHCANDTIKYNDRLSWLFAVSSSLYPSIYLNDGDVSDENKLRVGGILRESLRVRDTYSPYTPIYAYSRFTYRNSDQFYNKDDLLGTIGQSFDAGMDGIVMWEWEASFKSKSKCLAIQKYLDTFMGPLIREIAEFASYCSVSLCNGHGKCVNINWHIGLPWKPEYISWKNQNYKCKCYKHWTGKYCDKKDLMKT